MGDPVTAAAAAAAQAAAKAAFTFLATKAVEGSHCRENMDDAGIIIKTWCMVVRGIAGSNETELKERLNSQIKNIAQTIDVVNEKVSIINTNVNRLLTDMDLLHLEISEAIVGNAAYSAIQDINVKYNRYAEVFKGINPESLTSTGVQATTFFKDLIYSEKLYDKMDIIHNALLGSASLPGKEGLLRNAIRQISVKGEKKPLLDCYTLYQEYVNSVMIPLVYGNLLVETGLTCCEVLGENNKLDPNTLPFSTKDWKKRWKEQLERLLAGFNSHLEWFVLERSAEKAKGVNPFFLPADARQTFWRADAFCSRDLGYGLRGRIFSMGGQFDGTLKFKDNTTAAGVKSAVQIGPRLDYWSATTTPGVYDKVVGFSDEWTVHRFYIPDVAAGGKVLDITLPYSPPAIAIGKINKTTFQASDQPSSTDPALTPFGSFVEIARAGGGFAFLSGGWVADNADNDSSNKGGEADIEKVTEYQNPSEYEIRDSSGMVAKVSRPEVGLVKGGWVHHGERGVVTTRGANSDSHANGSFRTWLQMAKTISVPAMGKNEALDVVASLVPAEGGFPGAAASLNNWLSGPAVRLTKPDVKITDDEVKRKRVIAGVNYDPSLAIPQASTSVKAGFRFCTVKDGKVGSYREISCANLSVGPFEKAVRREDATPDTLSSYRTRVWESYSGAVSLKFRLEAFYDFSIETSGLDVTPFAIYALGRLENAYLELGPGPTSSTYPPVLLEMKVKSSTARLFAFDYDGVGRLDNIVCDDGAEGAVRCYGREIDQPSRFSLRSKFDTNYCLHFTGGIRATPTNPADRAFAFDYAGSGKLDHLVFYRPGERMISIYKKNKDGYFESVYTSTTGIGYPDLADSADRGFAFDYAGSGKLDHLVFYRPGGRALGILKKRNDAGSFLGVYATGSGGITGIGGYDLASRDDRALAFDYDGSGKLDHLVLYRPGGRALDIFKITRDASKPMDQWVRTVYTTRSGIGGYDLARPEDRAIAFDYNSVGKVDHLMFYRPGAGACYIVKRNAAGKDFEALPGAQGAPGKGIGGYDLARPEDRAFAFDYDGFGKLDHLVLYRPGSGPLYILKKAPQGGFARIY